MLWLAIEIKGLKLELILLFGFRNAIPVLFLKEYCLSSAAKC